MRRSIIVIATVFLGSAWAQDDEPSKYPVQVPKGAEVTFEAEGTGKQFIPMVKRLLAVDPTDPTSGSKVQVTIKTSVGNLNLSFDDIAPLLSEIKMLHVASFRPKNVDNEFKSQEAFFEKLGYKRVISVPGPSGGLVMHRSTDGDEFGIVAQSASAITVLRTQGGPGMGDLGDVILGALTRLVSQAADRHKH